MNNKFLLHFLIGLSLFSGCSDKGKRVENNIIDTKPVVFVSNYPLYYFVDRLARASVNIHFPAKESNDPAYWIPNEKEIAKIQQADLIILNGASYEKWLSKVTLPELKLVITSNAFSDQFIIQDRTITHIHGPSGKHAHKGTAITTWLDLRLAVEQARAVKQALSKIKLMNAKNIEDRFSKLEKDLLDLDHEIEIITSFISEQSIIFSHPVYQYFERRYGLNGQSLHFEPDQMPDDILWAKLEKIASQLPVTMMIWEAKPLPEIIKKLEESGIKSIVFDPFGTRPETGDFITEMRKNIKTLQEAVK